MSMFYLADLISYILDEQMIWKEDTMNINKVKFGQQVGCFL